MIDVVKWCSSVLAGESKSTKDTTNSIYYCQNLYDDVLNRIEQLTKSDRTTSDRISIVIHLAEPIKLRLFNFDYIDFVGYSITIFYDGMIEIYGKTLDLVTVCRIYALPKSMNPHLNKRGARLFPIHIQFNAIHWDNVSIVNGWCVKEIDGIINEQFAIKLYETNKGINFKAINHPQLVAMAKKYTSIASATIGKVVKHVSFDDKEMSVVIFHRWIIPVWITQQLFEDLYLEKNEI